MKNKILCWVKTDIIIACIAAVYYLLLYLLDSTCIIKDIFHIQCPTCGMTRAIICLVKGDIQGYFNFNVLALPTIVVLYFYLHSNDGKAKKIFDVLLILLAVIIAARYIIIQF